MRRAVTVRCRAGDMREMRRWRHRLPSPRPRRSTRSGHSSPSGRSTIRPAATRLRRRPAPAPVAGPMPGGPRTAASGPHVRRACAASSRRPWSSPSWWRHHRVRRPRQGGAAHRRRGAAHPAHLRGRHRRTPRRRGHRGRRPRRRHPGPRRRPRRRRRDHRPPRAPGDPHPRRGAAPGVDHRRLGRRRPAPARRARRGGVPLRRPLLLDRSHRARPGRPYRTHRDLHGRRPGAHRPHQRRDRPRGRRRGGHHPARRGHHLRGPAQLPARRPDGLRDADHRLPRGARGARPVRRATVRGRFDPRRYGGRRARGQAGRPPDHVRGADRQRRPAAAAGAGRRGRPHAGRPDREGRHRSPPAVRGGRGRAELGRARVLRVRR